MTTLKRYQLEGALSIRQFGGCALLADEMGLGKSLQALYYAFKMKGKRPIIIVCPASLKWNWQREASHHLGMSSEILNGRVPHGPRLVGTAHPILIINFEILNFWLPFLVRLKPKIVIIDECHSIKNRKTGWFKAVKQLCEDAQIPHRIALSGTPLTNRPSELWTTLNVLRPDIYRSFAAFGFKFCIPRMIRGRWEYMGAKNLDVLHAQLLKHVMIRRLKSDKLPELPAKVREVIAIRLKRDARLEYEEARDDFIQWLYRVSPERAMKAAKAEAMVKVGYLLRLLARLKRHDTKAWIQNFLESSDQKIVIFSCHTKLVTWLCRQFPKIHVRIDGKVTGRDRLKAIDRFQTDPRCRLAIGNPKAAGVGLNMTAASHVLYCDFPWTPGILKQGEDRIHRIGQKERCFIWYLTAIGTIEDRLMRLLMEKQEVLDSVLDGKLGGGLDFEIFRKLLQGELKRAA